MKNKKSNKMSLAGKLAIAFGLGWSVFTGCKKAPEPKPVKPIAQKVMEKVEVIKNGFGTGTFQIYDSENGPYNFSPMMDLAKEELKELFKNKIITVKLGPSYSNSFANADVLIKSYEDANGYKSPLFPVDFAEEHQKNVLEQGTVNTSVNGKSIETPLKYINLVENNLMNDEKITITLNDKQYEFENYEILKQIKEDFWKEEQGASELEKGINELYEKEGYFERDTIKTPIKYIDLSDGDVFVTNKILDDETKEYKALTVYFDNKDDERTEFKFFDKEHLIGVKNEFGAEFKKEYTNLLNSEEGYIKAELNDEIVNIPLKYIKSRKNQAILNNNIKRDSVIGNYLTIQIGTHSPITFNLQTIENSRETHYVLWDNFKKYTEKFLVENNIREKDKVSISDYKRMYDCLNEMENRDETSNIGMINYKKLQVLDNCNEVKKEKIEEYFRN